MASSITLRLNDQVTSGLREARHELEETGQASGDVAGDVRQLSDAHREQMKVIHEHKGVWIQFAAALLNTGSTIISVGAKLQQTSMWVGAVNNTVAAAPNILSKFGSALAGVGTRAASLTKAITPARVAIVGLGGGLAATALAGVGLVSLFQRLGRSVDQAATATEAQRRKLEELRVEAAQTGSTIQEIAARNGVDLSKLGVEIITYYSRIRDAAEDVVGSVTRQNSAVIGGYRDWGLSLLGIGPLIDQTRNKLEEYTRTVEENLKALKGLSDAWADFRLGEGFAAQLEQTSKFNDLQKDIRGNFDRLRETAKKLQQETANADQVRELAAVKQLGDLDNLITKERQQYFLQASQRGLSEEEQAAHENRMLALTRRRHEIQRELDSETAKYKADTLRAELKAQEEAIKQLDELERQRYEMAQKIANQRANAVVAIEHSAIQERLKNAIAAMESEEAKAEDVHHARLQLIRAETIARVDAASNQLERERAIFDGQIRLIQAEGDFKRAQLAKDADARKEAAEKAIQIEKDKQERIKQLLAEAGGPSGADIIKQLDPNKVLNSFRNRRGNEAEAKFRQENMGKTDLGDARAQRRFEAQARAVRKEAEHQAYRDFRKGDVEPAELANAQMDASQQTLNAMQKNGELTSEVVKVLQQEVQTSATMQANVAVLQQQMQAIHKQSNQNQQGANRTRAQQGSTR